MKQIKNKNSILPLMMALSVLIFFSTGCKKDELDHSYPAEITPSNSSDINGLLINAITLKPISRGLVILSDETGTIVLGEKRADPNGKFFFSDVPDGVYSLKVQQNGYQTMIANGISVGEFNPLGNFVGLCPVESTIIKPIAAVSGIVLGQNSLPVGSATVAISADPENLTNGYFTSVLTDGNGQFYIPAIPLTSIDNSTITAFKIRVMKDTYDPVYETEVFLAKNQLKITNFTLEHSSGNEKIIFEEKFDSLTPWIYTGFWHRHENVSVVNKAFPQYVKLAPNDNSGGSAPDACSGKYSAWYGEESTGNYMGVPASGQAGLSGGTSATANAGLLISPPILVSSTTGYATLSFWTWFEIESNNPGSNGHDLMDILIVDANDTTQQALVGRLNPYIDPILDNRDAIPFTSGGFNQRPLWKYQAFDLTGFVGKTIRLGFRFETVDIYSNGFRGWFLDDIKVTGNSMGTLFHR